jgi:hydroxyacylglutathione hydrolase
MPRIPLEDYITDIIGKTQRGLKLTDEALATAASIPVADLQAVKGGEIRENTLLALARPLGLERNALEALAHKRWYPQQPIFPSGFAAFNTVHEDMTVNSYLVWDARNKVAAAFDTGATCEPMLDLIRAEGLSVRYIFITHTHPDHIADLDRLATETKAEVWASELEPAPFAGAKRSRRTRISTSARSPSRRCSPGVTRPA